MTVAILAEPTLESVETRLRDELAQGDAILSTAAPILRHLLVNEDQALFSDEVVARVRWMLTDVARQLLHALAEAAQIGERVEFVAEREAELELTAEEGEELDRRWSAHVQRPDSSIPWAEVRRKLLDRE